MSGAYVSVLSCSVRRKSRASAPRDTLSAASSTGVVLPGLRSQGVQFSCQRVRAESARCIRPRPEMWSTCSCVSTSSTWYPCRRCMVVSSGQGSRMIASRPCVTTYIFEPMGGKGMRWICIDRQSSRGRASSRRLSGSSDGRLFSSVTMPRLPPRIQPRRTSWRSVSRAVPSLPS